MLTPFPQLLIFGFYAPTILRIVAAGIFLYLGMSHFKHKKEVAHEISMLPHTVAVWGTAVFIIVEFAIAILLFLGLWTQIAALIGLIICLKIFLIKKGLRHLSPLSHISYILLGAVCLSLLFSGAGAIAMDLPL